MACTSAPRPRQLPVTPGIVRQIVSQSSGDRQTIVRQSPDNPQAMARQSSGNRQAIVRQSSGNRQTIVRQSSGNRQAIVRQSSQDDLHFTSPIRWRCPERSQRGPSRHSDFQMRHASKTPCPKHLQRTHSEHTSATQAPTQDRRAHTGAPTQGSASARHKVAFYKANPVIFLSNCALLRPKRHKQAIKPPTRAPAQDRRARTGAPRRRSTSARHKVAFY